MHIGMYVAALIVFMLSFMPNVSLLNVFCVCALITNQQCRGKVIVCILYVPCAVSFLVVFIIVFAMPWLNIATRACSLF